MIADVAMVVLLAVGLALLWLATLGLLAMGNVYDRLHFAGAATLAVPLVAAAIVVEDGVGPLGIKAVLTAAVVVFTSPILTQATARAGRLRDRGEWKPQPQDGWEVEER